MVIKQRKCKECREKYTPVRPMQVGCGYDCDIQIALKASVKARIKREQAAKKEDKEYKRVTVRRMKALLDTDPKHWAKRAKTACHLYIRTLYANEPCFTCGTTNDVEYAAGHFIPDGRAAALRYDERNIRKQCNMYCNKSLSGNVLVYRSKLVSIHGEEYVQELERIGHTQKRWTIDELKEVESYYKAKLRELKNV